MLEHRSYNTTDKRNHHESKEDGYIIITPFFRFVKPYRKEDFFMAKKSNSRRDDGRIAVQVYIGMVDGKRKYKTFYGKTQKEANAKAEEFRNSIGKNADMLDDTTLRFWAEKWCKMRVEETTEERAENSHVKASMYVTYSPIVERWVEKNEKITTLGDMPMQQIKLYHHMMKMKNWLLLLVSDIQKSSLIHYKM